MYRGEKNVIYDVCLCVRYNDVLQRCKELDSWTQDLALPSVVWLSGLFNPQSFLTGKTHICSHNRSPSLHSTSNSPVLCLITANTFLLGSGDAVAGAEERVAPG